MGIYFCLVPNICALKYSSLPISAYFLTPFSTALDKVQQERGWRRAAILSPIEMKKKSLRHMVLHKITIREKPAAVSG